MKRTFSHAGCCGLACLAGATAVLRAQDLSISAMWDSNYVSEGRKNLEHDGFVQAEIDLEAAGFSFCAWHGYGRGDDYREWNFSVEKAVEVGAIELAASYTHLVFGGSASGSDDELGVAAVLGPASRWQVEVGAKWSFEAKGAFVEAQIAREVVTAWWNLVMRPYVLLASDFGYASEDYDGLNHWECGLEVEWPVTETLAIGAHLARSEPLGDVRRDGGSGFFWGGISAGLAF